jgi:hypothetical protein
MREGGPAESKPYFPRVPTIATRTTAMSSNESGVGHWLVEPVGPRVSRRASRGWSGLTMAVLGLTLKPESRGSSCAMTRRNRGWHTNLGTA